MSRYLFVAVLVFGCREGKPGAGQETGDVDWPYQSTGTAAGTNGGPGGTGTGTGTGQQTGSGPGASTGTGTGVGTGTGPGTGGGSGAATGTGTGTGGTGTTNQCSPAIPNNTTVVDNDLVTSTGTLFWVCAHNVLSFSGTGATIFVDVQADAVVNGENNTIYIVDRGDLAIFAANNTVWWETGAAVNDQQGGNTLIECPVMNFDLTNAPNPGC